MATRIESYRISNANGLSLEVLNLGATIRSLDVPNKDGGMTNVVIGLANTEEYLSPDYWSLGYYFGSVVGRCAGRISRGGFNLNNQFYPLTASSKVHLHGGSLGFDKKIWSLKDQSQDAESYVELCYTSADGEEGYPGNLEVNLRYTLLRDNALEIKYTAKTDKKTVVNLTNHSYFNLNGQGTVLNHQLQIKSNQVLETDQLNVPTGRLCAVKGTPFDRRDFRAIQDLNFNGFDDTFVLLGGNDLKAKLSSYETGIEMEVYTNQKGMVVYTPEKLEKLGYLGGAEFSRIPAICFETQNFPDAINNGAFPDVVLEPNDTYQHVTRFNFKTIT